MALLVAVPVGGVACDVILVQNISPEDTYFANNIQFIFYITAAIRKMQAFFINWTKNRRLSLEERQCEPPSKGKRRTYGQTGSHQILI